MSRKSLLIVSNTPSQNTAHLAAAVLRGAQHEDIDEVQAMHLQPLDASAEHVLSADAIIIGTTENFGYMSGLMKDFFERIYYPCLEHTEGLPYALYIRAGLDGTGARSAVERIVTGLKWRAVQPALVLQGDYRDEFTHQCEELGTLMGAGLDSGVY